MNTIRLICFSLGMAAGTQTWAGEVVIPAAVNDQITQALSQPLNVLAVDIKVNKQNQQLMRTWVGGSVDLSKAVKRTSQRFSRTTYKSQVTKDVIRLPRERMRLEPLGAIPSLPAAPAAGPAAAQPLLLKKISLQLGNALSVNLTAPMTVFYREGVSEFKFHKIKEVVSKRPLNDRRAMEAAKMFVSQNKLLHAVADDQVGQTYVQKRYVSEEGADGGAQEKLLQQDVVFERTYQGQPVINSKLVVGLLPDNHEIVMLKHYNWTPVETSVQNNRPVAKVKRSLPSPNAQAIVQRLRDKITNYSGTFQSADVQEATPAWYQMQDQMIPVMLFKVDMKYPSEIGTLQRDVLEVINLAGDDAMLFQQAPPKQPPKNAP